MVMDENDHSGAPALMGTPTDLGHRLRFSIDRAGISMSEAARRVGLSQAAISKLVSGQTSGSKHLYALAQVLGVNPIWLAQGTGSPDVTTVTDSGQLNRDLMRRVIIYALPVLRSDTLTATQIADMLLQLHDHWAVVGHHDSTGGPAQTARTT